jgi:hypothetical protein
VHLASRTELWPPTVIYISCLLKVLFLELDKPLAIECDNRQTIRLLAKSAKLQTKLRNVDIYSHWLCQDVQWGAITLTWQESKKLMADGLTKALSQGPFDRFIGMIGLEEQEEKLKLIQREEDLREQLKELKSNERVEEARYATSKDMRDL